MLALPPHSVLVSIDRTHVATQWPNSMWRANLSNWMCDVTKRETWKDNHLGDACIGGRILLKQFLKEVMY